MKHTISISVSFLVLLVSIGVYVWSTSSDDVIRRLASQDDGQFQSQIAVLGKYQSLEVNQAQAVLARAGEEAIPSIANALLRVLEKEAQLDEEGLLDLKNLEQQPELKRLYITKLQLLNLLKEIGGESADALAESPLIS